jgi:hypothetical protein
MKRSLVLRLCLALSMLVLTAALQAAPTRADSPHLDDNRGAGSSISIAGDVCTSLFALLGGDLTSAVVDLLGGAICPGISGRVLSKPHIWNVFAGDNWDGNNSPMFSEGAINNYTKAIIDGTPGDNYLGPAGQYGVGSASFDGSSSNNGCGGAPSGTTNQASIELWITCEVQSPGTGVPYPDDNTLYIVYLPPSVDINAGPLGGTCNDFAAYHLQSMALTAGFQVGLPPVFVNFQSYPYAVIPLKCANGTVDGLTKNMSHEMIEAMTDPIGPHGWADNATITNGTFLKGGEAADLCEQAALAPYTLRLDNGTLVAPYWSNNDNQCAPLTHALTLRTVGLPNAGHATLTSLAYFNDTAPHDVDLSTQSVFRVVDRAHITWSWPSPVSGAPGVRYTTGDNGGDGPTPIDSEISDTALYGEQDFLTVNTAPASVAASDASLTGSQWVPHSQTVTLTTDPFVPSGADRYRFTSWTGGLNSTSTTAGITMNGPQTATANYTLQHQVTFAQTGIPGGVPWTVTVNGVAQAGSYSAWYDHGSFVDFSYQDPVPDLTPGTRYKLVGATATTPLLVSATGPVVATYKTQYLLTVHSSGLPAPNLANVTNGGTALGTVNDTSPLVVWMDKGTPLLGTLTADADVNGVDGTQYFFQGFTPVPPAAMGAAFTTTAGYMTMAQLIQAALKGGGITGPSAAGVGTALTQQFAAIQADMGARQYAPALGALTAFINLGQAQCCTPNAGKELTPSTARTFQLDALLVYHAALVLGVGQVSAAQETSDYTYYKQLVTSLGGTVLPPAA